MDSDLRRTPAGQWEVSWFFWLGIWTLKNRVQNVQIPF
jgi:hypothetical protein